MAKVLANTCSGNEFIWNFFSKSRFETVDVDACSTEYKTPAFKVEQDVTSVRTEPNSPNLTTALSDMLSANARKRWCHPKNHSLPDSKKTKLHRG